MRESCRLVVGLIVAILMAGGPSLFAQTKAPAAAKGKGRVIEMTGNDQMKYNVTAITAKPGEVLTVRLTTIGKIPKFAMAHNFVLLTKGSDPKAFADKAIGAKATEYIPAELKKQIIAQTGMAGPGETVEVTFKAPTAAGKYDYLCSFPGHFAAGMKGVLTVG
jgi:azurin